MRDITGEKHSRLTAAWPVGRNKSGVLWLCFCDCGEQRIVAVNRLRSGHIKMCAKEGAEHRASSDKKWVTKHGHSRDGSSSEYTSWCHMKSRCLDKNASHYSYYGGRGIRVCERWKNSFMDFMADMGPKPTKQHTLERVDNEGNYEPSNCKWATRKEQGQNRRPKSRHKKNAH